MLRHYCPQYFVDMCTKLMGHDFIGGGVTRKLPVLVHNRCMCTQKSDAKHSARQVCKRLKQPVACECMYVCKHYSSARSSHVQGKTHPRLKASGTNIGFTTPSAEGGQKTWRVFQCIHPALLAGTYLVPLPIPESEHHQHASDFA